MLSVLASLDWQLAERVHVRRLSGHLRTPCAMLATWHIHGACVAATERSAPRMERQQVALALAGPWWRSARRCTASAMCSPLLST
jgi:hypothetical protein